MMTTPSWPNDEASDVRWFVNISRAIDAIRDGRPRRSVKPDRYGRTVRIGASLVCHWCYRPYSSPKPGRTGLFCSECQPTAKQHYREHVSRTKAFGGLVAWTRDDYFTFRCECLRPNLDGLPLVPRERTDGISRTKPEGHSPPLSSRCPMPGCGKRFKVKGSHHPNSRSFDHIWPLEKGGPHCRLNGRWICRSCNAGRQRRKGLDVPLAQARPIVAWLEAQPNATADQVERGRLWLEAIERGSW